MLSELADTRHNLSDVLGFGLGVGLGLAWDATWLGRRPSCAEQP